MNKLIFDVKQLKINKFIKPIWQLIISSSNATLEVPLLRPWSIEDRPQTMRTILLKAIYFIKKFFDRVLTPQIFVASSV